MCFKKIAATFIAVLLALNLAHAAEPTVGEQWDALAQQIQAKINSGKTSESDFTGELAAWDKLIAAPGNPTNDIADLVYKKAELYVMLFNDLDKSEQLYRKVSEEYPGYRLASQAAHNSEILEQQIAKKRVQDSLAPGSVFPDFAVQDMQGKSLSVSNYAGKIVLVDFWATWCPPCLVELPSIVKLYKTHHDQGFEVIGVSLNKTEEREDLVTFFKKNPDVKWPQYFDGLFWQNKLAVKYGIEQTPSNILIGRDGRIIGKNLHGPALDEAITKALATK